MAAKANSTAVTKLLFPFVIFLGLIWTLPLSTSGRQYPFGIGFWGPNGHDSIWHLSLINHFSWPPPNPNIADTQLQNYHWGYDALISFLWHTSHLDLSDLYFRYFPIICSILTLYLVYRLIYLQTRSSLASALAVFLTVFSGSLGWLANLYFDHSLGGESRFWAMQSISTWLNPPYALSLLILLLATYSLSRILLDRRPSRLTVATYLLSVLLLPYVKIYPFILLSLSTGFYLLLNLHQLTRTKMFLVLAPIILTTLTLFPSRLISPSSSLIKFQPFWFTHSLVESLDKFYLPRLASLRFNLAAGSLSLKSLIALPILEVFFIGLFYLGNLGPRLLALLSPFRFKFFRQPLFYLWLGIIFIGLLIPLFFIQSGTAWNTIQFFYYSQFFLNMFLAIFIIRLKSTILRFTLVLLIIANSLLSSWGTLRDYFGFPPPAALTNPEISLINQLNLLPPGTILTSSYSPEWKKSYQTPIPLFAYESTSYLSAFTHHQAYLADEMNLSITDSLSAGRQESIRQFFRSTNPFEARGILINNRLDYLLLNPFDTLTLPVGDLPLALIYQDQGFRLYKVLK